MGWRHCKKCDEDMDRPTIEEDLIDGQVCWRCGTEQDKAVTLEEWMVELSTDIREIKTVIKALKYSMEVTEGQVDSIIGDNNDD